MLRVYNHDVLKQNPAGSGHWVGMDEDIDTNDATGSTGRRRCETDGPSVAIASLVAFATFQALLLWSIH